MARRVLDYEANFWSKVAKGGPDECWLWTASFASNGYGNALDPRVARNTRGAVSAHRLAYFYANGEHALCARHRCPGEPDKRCCNPAHIVNGTFRDNALDKTTDGTQCRGETNGNAVLTEAAVLEARRLRAEGWKITPLAERYGCQKGALSSALVGKSWKHLPGAIRVRPPFQGKAA